MASDDERSHGILFIKAFVEVAERRYDSKIINLLSFCACPLDTKINLLEEMFVFR